MSVYKFHALEGGDWTIQKDSGQVIEGSSNAQAVAAVVTGKVHIQTYYPFYEALINLDINTIEIDDVDVTANGAAAIVEQLNENVFTGTSAGGGGTLQEVLDAGSTLDKDNVINGNINESVFTYLDFLRFGRLYLRTEDGAYLKVEGGDVAIGSSYGGLTGYEIAFVGEGKPKIKDLSGNEITKEIATVNYKVYTALLSQSGTDAPVATVLENTLGDEVVWSRTGSGVYEGTLANAFPEAKTFTLLTTQGVNINGGWNNVNSVYIITTDGTSQLDALNGSCIEVRVYP